MDNEVTSITEPPTKVQPPTQPHQPPRVDDIILGLKNLHTKHSFRSPRSDHIYIDREALIENHVTISGMTYDQLEQLTTDDIPITRVNFIRMWKTLILKRTQDTLEADRKRRPQNYVRVHKSVKIPATLADLLYNYGSFHSMKTGYIYTPTPPPRPAANVPLWWNLDDEILDQWQRTMEIFQYQYDMREYPALNTVPDKPLILTFRDEANNFSEVKAWTNEPTIIDAYIRMTHDDLFVAHEYMTYANCAINMSKRARTLKIRQQYISSYILEGDS